MKKCLLLLAFVLSMGCATASDVLTVENVTLPQNSEAVIAINCEFDTQFKGYQLDMELDGGLTLVLDEDDKPIGQIGFEGTDHSVSSSQVSDGHYRFVVVSMTAKLLPTSGTLLKVRVTGGAEKSVGDSFDARITATEFTSTSNEACNLSDVAFTITIGEPVDTRTVLDENSTVEPVAETNADVRVLRTINADEWSTICLPFAMTEAQCKAAFGEDVQIADFVDTQSTYDDADNVVGISISFDDVTAIEANHPYIIKVAQPVTEFTVDNVDIDPAEDDALVEVDNGLTGRRRVVYGSMYGTYHAQTTLEEYSLFLSNNQFWYSTGLTEMKAFRAYFVMADVLTDVENASSRISLAFADDDMTTGIKNHGQKGRNGNTYNLQGQRVGKFRSGLYIRNGKKFIVK